MSERIQCFNLDALLVQYPEQPVIEIRLSRRAVNRLNASHSEVVVSRFTTEERIIIQQWTLGQYVEFARPDLGPVNIDAIVDGTEHEPHYLWYRAKRRVKMFVLPE